MTSLAFTQSPIPAAPLVATARYDEVDGIAIITLDGAPINSMGLSTRQAMMAGFIRARDNASVSAIVLTGANGVFTGGADIKEFGLPIGLQSPNLFDFVTFFEECKKPVISAINGVCMGGGLELSLVCHYRVATAKALIGLPEVLIGLLPGAGGTQRLPRLAGAAVALEMICGGKPKSAVWLKSNTQVLDAVFDSRDTAFLQDAVAFAKVQSTKAKHPRVRDIELTCDDEVAVIIAQARAQALSEAANYPAVAACVDAIEAAHLLPIDVGLQKEFALFNALLATSESAALRHAFFAERAAGKVQEAPESRALLGIPRDLKKIGIVGAGTMGCGIALAFLDAGFATTLVEVSETALQRGVDKITKAIQAQADKGRISAAQAVVKLANLNPQVQLQSLADMDLVVEAVFEDFALKRDVFKALDAILKPGAILTSNTSTLDLDALAAVTKRPADVVGLHFFSPANIMRLLEIVRGKDTAPDVLVTALGLAKRLGKVGVVAGVCDGFIGNRMIEQYLRQALFLLEEGASVAQVDGAMERFGWAMGPFRMADLAGNDIGWAIRKRRYVQYPQMRYPIIADKLCEQGRFGQKTNAGWYDYTPGERAAKPSDTVTALLLVHRSEIGAKVGMNTRTIDDAEIVERLMFALLNEGAAIMREGIAARASDIDVVYLTGYGFPRFRGGPMFFGQQFGFAKAIAAMRGFAKLPNADAEFWQPDIWLLEACKQEAAATAKDGLAV
jgi:3-hydroxyacyl-CoA dehydrogenase